MGLEAGGVEKVEFAFFDVASEIDIAELRAVKGSRKQAVPLEAGEALFKEAEVRGIRGGTHGVHLGGADVVFRIELGSILLLALDGIEEIGGDEHGVVVGGSEGRVSGRRRGAAFMR